MSRANSPTDRVPPGQTGGKDALALAAAAQVLRPLVDLLMAHGVQFGALSELLKQLLVDAARRRVPGAAQERAVSRISVATGIHRKEIKRLIESPVAVSAEAGRSAASQVFTRWLTDKRYVDRSGRPRELARQAADHGGAPSFEALAREVSSDVHPRTLLDELARLQMVEVDGDRVRIKAQSFVPASEDQAMLRFLAENVRDHLAAAVANVDGATPRFLEQAVFAERLSEQSAAAVDALVRQHWQRLFKELVPELQRLVQADRDARRPGNRRTRIGMYNYSTHAEATGTSAGSTSKGNRRTRAKRKP